MKKKLVTMGLATMMCSVMLLNGCGSQNAESQNTNQKSESAENEDSKSESSAKSESEFTAEKCLSGDWLEAAQEAEKNGETGIFIVDDEVAYIYGKGDLSNYHPGQYAGLADKYPIKKVVILDGVTGVVAECFADMPYLTEVDVAGSVEYIQGSSETATFKDCKALQKVVFEQGNLKRLANVFEGCTSLSEVTLPDGIETLDGTFLHCSILSDINLPSSLNEIGDNTFTGCPLKEIAISDKIINIGNGAFGSCGLEKIELPETLKSIGNQAFWANPITEINLPDGLESIGEKAFWGCDMLEEIEIPDSVTTIGEFAFRHCSNLKKVKLPAGLDETGFSISECFFESPAVEELTIPVNLTDYKLLNGDWLLFPNLKVVYGEAGSYTEEYINKYNSEFGTQVQFVAQ